MQRDARKHLGGMWEVTAGGSALQGESSLDCAIRELHEFVVLLQQRKEDLDTLQKLFSLSPSQESYLKTGKKGSGLIVCGRKIIPFEKPIPTDSLMYKICTTKFGEN